MRIADVVHDAMNGRDVVVDANRTPFTLSRYLPTTVQLLQHDDLADRGTAVVLTVLAEQESPGSTTDDLAYAATQLRDGDILVALLSEEIAHLVASIADYLSAEGLQISRLVPLGYERLTVAVVAEKGHLRPVGLPSDAAPLDPPVDWNINRAYLRISNEHIVTSYQHRALEQETLSLREELGVAQSRLSVAENAGARSSDEQPGVAKEHREALARLRAAEDELSRLTAELENIRGTTAWQAGLALVEAGKNPSQAPATLKRLMRLWRGRAEGGTASHRRTEPRTLEAELDGEQILASLRRSAGAPSGMTACGLIGDRVGLLLRACGLHIDFLLPHDPPSSVIGFDMFIIDAAELALSGRWYGTGHPGSPHQDAALVAAVDAAEAAGIPVVIIPSEEPLPPGLGTLAPSATYLSPTARRAVALGDQRLMTAHATPRSRDVPLLARAPWPGSWSHGAVLDLNSSVVDPVAIGLRHERVAVWSPDDGDFWDLIVPLTAAGALVVTDAATESFPGVVTHRDLIIPDTAESLDERLTATWLSWWECFSPEHFSSHLPNLNLRLNHPGRPVAILTSGNEAAVSAAVRERRFLDTVIVMASADAPARELAELAAAGLDAISVDDWKTGLARLPDEAAVWLPGSRQLTPLLAARGVTGADVVQGGDDVTLSSLAPIGSQDLLVSRRLLSGEPLPGMLVPTVFTVPCPEAEVLR